MAKSTSLGNACDGARKSIVQGVWPQRGLFASADKLPPHTSPQAYAGLPPFVNANTRLAPARFVRGAVPDLLSGWRERRYPIGVLFDDATPVAFARITPDWSEKK